jgi:TRAP-type C4-dicarboxylate transport system substrate-binding protein
MADRMPLTAVTELPGIFQTTCQGNAALRALTREGAILDTAEFKPNGIHPLIIFLMPAYQLMLSSSRKLDSIADVEGLKIRTPGGAMDLTAIGLKAVPIRVSPPEIYESMSRGTLDGALLSYQSVESYHLSGLLKSGTLGEDFGTVTISFSIADWRWNQLPDDVRAAMTEAGAAISERACTAFDQAEAESIAKVRAAGVKLIANGDADRGALTEAFADIRERWAARLDAEGKPGHHVLSAFTAAAAGAAE